MAEFLLVAPKLPRIRGWISSRFRRFSQGAFSCSIYTDDHQHIQRTPFCCQIPDLPGNNEGDRPISFSSIYRNCPITSMVVRSRCRLSRCRRNFTLMLRFRVGLHARGSGSNVINTCNPPALHSARRGTRQATFSVVDRHNASPLISSEEDFASRLSNQASILDCPAIRATSRGASPV